MHYWYNKSLLKISDHPAHAVGALLDLAATLKAEKKAGREKPRLQGKNIALIFEKTSTRTRCAFEVACYDQGARCTYIAPSTSQMGGKESIADTAQVLARFYDAIEYRGFAQQTVETLAKFAQKPVYNGLTDDFHPTQMLADLLTMREHSPKPFAEIAFAYIGDARNNMGHSLLLTGALMGMDVRIIAPQSLQPRAEIVAEARALAAASGARVTISDEASTLAGVDFVYSDIWVSMGESDDVWAERLPLLLPYRITPEFLAQSGNPNLKWLHCLPAYHDRSTPLGEKFYQQYQLVGVEVADEVFNGAQSIVFDQAENRLHTIKALLVATLAGESSP